MTIVSKSKQVSQAVKNVGRLRTILGTFGRHGLEEFLLRMNLRRYLPATKHAAGVESLTVPERLRMTFESLGPTFVKLGQLLSNRPDMIPDNFIAEFQKLQDNVAPLSFETIRATVERELGGKLEDRFQSFNPEPLASASIAQVHAAVLKTGEDVVVKVQRPDIDRVIKTDISILRFLAGLMEKYLPETRIIGPVQIVEEFFAVLTYELDFIVEANTTQKAAKNFEAFPRVIIPKVYRELTTHKILTLQRLNGIRIVDVAGLKANSIEPREIVDLGARVFFKMLLRDGLFHGDLHGGNLFAMKDQQTGQSQLGVIDFGIVGRLNEKARDAFTRMVFALVTEDYETLCYEYAELGAAQTSIDMEKFQHEVQNAIAPYMGLSLKDVNIGAVLIECTRIAVRYEIKIPGEWMVVFKAIFTIEGLGRQLDPDFDFLGLGNELAKELVKDRYSVQRFSKDFAFIARDVTSLMQTTPRQLRLMFRKLNSNDFAFEVKFREIEILRRQMERGSRGIGFSLITASFFIAGVMSMQAASQRGVWNGFPIIALIFFGLGLVGFAGLLFRSWK